MNSIFKNLPQVKLEFPELQLAGDTQPGSSSKYIMSAVKLDLERIVNEEATPIKNIPKEKTTNRSEHDQKQLRYTIHPEDFKRFERKRQGLLLFYGDGYPTHIFKKWWQCSLCLLKFRDQKEMHDHQASVHHSPPLETWFFGVLPIDCAMLNPFEYSIDPKEKAMGYFHPMRIKFGTQEKIWRQETMHKQLVER